MKFLSIYYFGLVSTNSDAKFDSSPLDSESNFLLKTKSKGSVFSKQLDDKGII